jgi:hydroxymethylbilane synthase
MCGVRGNVETRLAKLDRGDFDAIVLAEAGLDRLGLQDRITEVFALDAMLPAAGQGALGIECRADDADTPALLSRISDSETEHAVQAERAVLAALRAGCHAPVGAFAQVERGRLALRAVVLSLDGKIRLEAKLSGPPDDGVALGRRVAEDLLRQGAAPLVAAH